MIHKRIAWLTLLMLLAVLISATLATATAAFQEQTSQEERVLEDLIPANVPIKIKIRKEKEEAFKDLRNDKWAQDFELEVTNIGDKPIYYLYLHLSTDVIAVEGYHVAFTLAFGRTELGEIFAKAEPDDVAIKPGETIVLKFHPGNLKGYTIRQRETNRPHPKIIKVKFQWLSFGDGTGFGPGGIALPRKL